MTKENSAEKALGFLNKHSKKIIFSSVILAVVAIAAAGGLWYYYGVVNKDVVARVGNDIITTAEYTNEQQQCIAGQKFAGVSPDVTTVGSTSCSDKALEDLIYLDSLRQDATKYGINVDAQVQSDYQGLVVNYKDEATMLAAFKSNLSESKDDILKSLEVRDLEDALSDKLLKKVHVLGTFVRDDVWGDTNISQEEQDALALVKKYYEGPMASGASIQTLEQIADTLRKENPKYDNDVKTLTGVNDTLDSLNESNISEWFNGGDTTDWDAIKKLNKVGDVTPAFVSPDGEAVIWRLVSVNNGTYNSWDDYKKAAVSKSKTYLLSYNVERVGTEALALLAPTKAFASCALHNAEMTLSHIYYSGTTVSVGSTNVEATFSATTNNYDEGCSTSVKSGTLNPLPTSLDIGNASTSLNCGTMWNLTYQSLNATFFPLKYYSRSFVTNGSNVHADNHLVLCDGGSGYDCDAYAREYNGPGSSDYVTINNDTNEEGDNDGVIVVNEIFPPTVSYVAPTDGTVFTAATIGGSATIGQLTGSVADTNSKESDSLKIEYLKTKDGSGNPVTSSWTNFGCSASSSPDGVNQSVAYYTSAQCANAAASGSNNSGWYHLTSNNDQAQDFVTPGSVLSEGPSLSLPAGTYEWAIQGEDISGQYGSWIVGRIFTVKDPNPVLGVTLTATPNSGTTTFSSSLLATVTGTATGNIQYQFDCDGNGTWDFTSPSTASTTYTQSCSYANAGLFNAKVQVTRPYPSGSTATSTALVTAVAPPATCTINATPSSGLSPLVVKVVVTPTGNLGSNSYSYNMGDGGSLLSGRGTVLYYTYADASTYKIVVTNGSTTCLATTNADGTSSDTVTVGNANNGTGGEVSP
jgi:hypothetical protein